jgi:RNA polymerase primary sigma factor
MKKASMKVSRVNFKRKNSLKVKPVQSLSRRPKFPSQPNEEKIINLTRLLKPEAPTLAPAEPARREDRRPYDGNTAFKLYLREVGQTRLLTPAEEVTLARRIKRGDRAAREQMIKANLRLVVKIAHGYEDCGMPLLDLISEGNVGLMKAVERFDPTKGAKLSTYSAWWIKQSIKRALANQSKTIRLPIHVVDKLFRIRRAAVKMQQELGHEPTDEELGGELGMRPAKIAQLRTAAIRPISLETPFDGDEDSNQISETVKDENANTPYEQLEQKTNTNMVRQLTSTLAPRELEILRCRFGLDGENEKTLDEVGHKFGLTRERIRQIQNVALKKLRKSVEKLEGGIRFAA